ncbi:ABC transporter ATP-binding protein [Bosea sp. NPDC003192]|uniref:ABC transporter ATP-binding protein n=1 Tax=Bosea sp. NPDC003192 TaxID=3390551 RepID=UPI003D00B784
MTATDHDETAGVARTQHEAAASAPVSLGAVAGRLLALMHRRRGLLALSIVCGTAAALLSLTPYLAAALALAALLDGTANGSWLAFLGLVALAGVAGRHALFALSTGLSHHIAFATQEELRLELAAKLARVPLGFFDDRSKGELRTVLLDDVEGVEDGMAHLVPEFSAAIVVPVVAILLLALIDWRLTILALLPLCLGMVLIGRVMRQGEGVTRDYLQIQARMAETVAEMADGLPTVRAFNQDGQATARARRAFAEMTELSENWARHAVVPGSVAQVLLTSHLLFAAPAGLGMAAMGWIGTGTLAAFLAVTYGLGDVFSSLQGISHRLMKQVELLDRIDAVLATPELPAPTQAKTPADASVRFVGVTFSYGSRRVLDGIELEVAPGRCLALVGPSGSGKSTLARLIARFHDVEAGAIQIGGVDVRKIAPDVLNAHVAYVFQDVFLFAGTVAENIRLAKPAASDDEVIAAAQAAQAHDFISALPQGYDTLIGERGFGLSGGERQHISIARAILKDAPILILDEATAFADPENEALIQDAIAALARQRTLIVIAHRLHTIAQADLIAVLDGGRVAEQGSHAELLAKDRLYAAMWRAQEEVRRHRHASGQPDAPVTAREESLA